MKADPAEPAALALSEWQTATPDSHPVLRGRFLTPEARRVAASLNNDGLLKVAELRTGLQVTANSRVGRVRLGDLEIGVRPKLPFPALLPLVRYAHGLRDLKTVGDAAHPGGPAALEDLLVAQLLAEANELLSRGLARSYRTRSERLASPRGRIEVHRLAAGPLTTAALPCRHAPRTADTPLNHALAAGLRLAAGVAVGRSLARGCRRLATALEEHAAPARLTPALLRDAGAAVNRLTAAYRPALTIVRLLLEARGVSLDGSAGGPTLPGFLFDMNAFFQALLSRFLRDHLPPDLTLHDERTLQGAVRYAPGYNPRGRTPPRLRPDFTLARGGRTAVILDAKYRDLWAEGLPAGMLYQLAVYALAHPRLPHATILYPAADPAAREERLEVTDPTGGAGRARVRLCPVDLGRLADLLTAGSVAERAEYAAGLTGFRGGAHTPIGRD